MASKEVEKTGDAPEQTDAAAPPKKGLGKIFGALKTKKGLMIAVPALLVVLGGAGGAGYFFLMKPAGEAAHDVAEDAPITPPNVTFAAMPDILVNIQSGDGTPAYLKLSVALEMESAEEQAGMEALKPRLVDQFQAYLRELRVDDLKGSAGVLRIKEELLRRVNVAAAPYKVRDVLLKEMIVQ